MKKRKIEMAVLISVKPASALVFESKLFHSHVVQP